MLYKEAARVLRSQGILAIIEFKKIDGPPGRGLFHGEKALARRA
jgi:ubiquinone/menaquinone biosynthesis C-methylase UbiE